MIAEIAGYGLVFLVGSVVGATGMRFGSLRLRRQKEEQLALKKAQHDLAQCYHGLVENSAGYLALLKKMASDSHKFHQRLVMTMSELVPENIKNNLLDDSFDTIDEDPMLAKGVPCDYSTDRLGLLQSRKQGEYKV